MPQRGGRRIAGAWGSAPCNPRKAKTLPLVSFAHLGSKEDGCSKEGAGVQRKVSRSRASGGGGGGGGPPRARCGIPASVGREEHRACRRDGNRGGTEGRCHLPKIRWHGRSVPPARLPVQHHLTVRTLVPMPSHSRKDLSGKQPSRPDSSGQAWQEYVNRLLATHYTQQGHQYICVPAKVGGDGGIEGFATTGDAYQCYADEASVSTADRARKQKRKITDDLGKLAKPGRLAFWTDLFQGTKIARWHLVVPVIEDKAVLVHARKKGAALQGKGLPFLTPDFQATVISASEAFPVASKALSQSGISFIPDGYTPACATDLAAFTSAQGDQVAKLESKLKKIPQLRSPSELKQATSTLLQRFLDSENLLARVRATNPTLWEQMLLQRQEHARNLETENFFDTSPPQQRVKAAKDRFCAALNGLSQSPASTASETIATGSIGLWLLECPLDFPELTNA
jgi:hypothetical protein